MNFFMMRAFLLTAFLTNIVCAMKIQQLPIVEVSKKNLVPSLRFLMAASVARDIIEKKKTLQKNGRDPLNAYDEIRKKCPHEVINFVQLLVDTNLNIQEAFSRSLCSKKNSYSYSDVKDLIQAGADLDKEDASGFTPLMQTVKVGLVNSAELLLDFGAKIDGQNTKKITPIILAVNKNYSEMVDFLLCHGADINQNISLGYEIPLFSYAIMKNKNPKVLAVFLKHKIDVNEVDCRGKTPLMYRHIPLTIVHGLLKRGANVNHRMQLNVTALGLSVLNHENRKISLLLANNADVNNRDSGGMTPLILAAKYNNFFAINEFLARGAHIDVQDTVAGMTALTYAAKFGHLRIVSALLAKGADSLLRNFEGKMAMELAQEWSVRSNQDVLIGSTTIHLGTKEDYKQIIKLLKRK